MSKRSAVLASGTGSLLEAMIEDKLPISLMLADRHCRAYDEVASSAGLMRELLPREFGGDFDRVRYTLHVVEVLKLHRIDVVIMAGWMTIFSPIMFEHFGGRILNSHPSLLPAFKGPHAVRDAWEAGAQVSGTTIHIATEKLDDESLILAQQEVPRLPGDTVESWHERIKQVERVLYPQTVRRFLQTL